MNNKQEGKHVSFKVVLAVAVCFLALVTAVSFYLVNPVKSGESVETRSVTMIDAGFDTPITFQATCSEDDFVKYSDIVKQVFTENNALFDQYNSYEGTVSILDVNENAADSPVAVDEKVIELLQLAKEMHALNPKFDVAQGKLLSLWHDAREADTPYVPDADAIAAAIDPLGMDGLVIDEENSTVYFEDAGMALDLGAVAKGYTAQLAKEALEEAGCTEGFINAGGNVVLIGHKADDKPWVVGIQNPDGNSSIVTVTLENPTSLVTSGDYQRYMEVDGVRYSHIIDVETGYPADYMRSVTVLNDDSALADGLSTVLFSMSLEDGMTLCKENGYEAIWILEKGQSEQTPDLQTDTFDIYVTEGLKDIVKLSQSSAS
jgi:thiamine biosynthesis lipoprotein